MNIIAGIMPLQHMAAEDLKIAMGSDHCRGPWPRHLPPGCKSRAVIQAERILRATGEQDHHYYTGLLSCYQRKSGSVFGKVGSFETGYAFNALVIDNMEDPWTKMTAEEKLERFWLPSEMTGILRRDILMGSCWSRNFRNLLFS